MKEILLLLLVVVTGLFFSGCADASGDKKPEAAAGYVKVTPVEAQKMRQENPDLIVLDVRTPEEYAEKHIPGARLLPNETISDQEIAGLEKEAALLVYCRTGRRSQQAANKLLALGYKHVYDMEGGITKWPYETEAGN